MQYTVVITKEPDTTWRAFAPFLPDCRAEAATREEALAQLTERIAQRQIEIVQIEVPTPSLNGAAGQVKIETTGKKAFASIRDSFGLFRADPMLGELFEQIETRRDEQRLGE